MKKGRFRAEEIQDEAILREHHGNRLLSREDPAWVRLVRVRRPGDAVKYWTNIETVSDD